jgi:hypothetical protein
MVREVHEMTETLVKIKAGTLSAGELDAINFDQNVFLDAHHHDRYSGDYDDDYDYGDDGYGDEDDDDFGIGNHRVIQKTLSKKGSQRKVTNKQLSSVLTAQVNNKKRR